MEFITQAIQQLPLGVPAKANEALRIPDIVRVILQNMKQDRPTLYRAIRLSKMWHEHGIGLLWESPPASALEHIVKVFPERQNYYASKIVRLYVPEDDGDRLHPLFSGLGDAFTKLKSVKIDPYYIEEGSGGRSCILQYISPTLETMHIYGADLPDDFLSRLAETSCRLRELLLEAVEDVGYPTPEALSTLVDSTPSIERYVFAVGMEEYLTETVWLSLARRQNVRAIQMDGLVDKELLRTIAESAEDIDIVPFSSLREFEGRMQCTAITDLIQLLPHLTKLELEVHGDELSVASHLPQLTHLRSLSIRVEDTYISPLEIIGLKKLTCLEVLILSSDKWNTDLDCRELTDENFKSLVGNLPELRVLDLYVDGFTAYDALETVAHHCPKIEELRLTRSYDLVRPDLPNRPGVMFPELRVLELGGFTSSQKTEQEPACITIRGLYTHLPKVVTIRIRVQFDSFNFISAWEPTEEAPYSSSPARLRRRIFESTSADNQ